MIASPSHTEPLDLFNMDGTSSKKSSDFTGLS